MVPFGATYQIFMSLRFDPNPVRTNAHDMSAMAHPVLALYIDTLDTSPVLSLFFLLRFFAMEELTGKK